MVLQDRSVRAFSAGWFYRIEVCGHYLLAGSTGQECADIICWLVLQDRSVRTLQHARQRT
jgi:hypothetical protein